MANIKISELNELYEAQKDYNDYVPVIDTSADETKKISVKNLIRSNVQLIAVTDTEPAEYETGDKYYNTTDNRIYTATSSGWANAETPIRNIFYVVISDKTTYTYDMDNETLISVGGGGGSSVVVEPDEPTEDTKLIIEESDLDFQGLDYVEDVYSTNEVKTNKVWIDGKPIYRKVFSNISITTGTGKYFATGLTNVNIIKLEGILNYSSASQYITIPSYYSSTIYITANYHYGQNRIFYDSGTFSGTAIFILEYTKTTD